MFICPLVISYWSSVCRWFGWFKLWPANLGYSSGGLNSLKPTNKLTVFTLLAAYHCLCVCACVCLHVCAHVYVQLSPSFKYLGYHSSIDRMETTERERESATGIETDRFILYIVLILGIWVKTKQNITALIQNMIQTLWTWTGDFPRFQHHAGRRTGRDQLPVVDPVNLNSMYFPALILSTWITDVIGASQHPWHHKDEQVGPLLHVRTQTCMYEVDQRERKVNIPENVYARRLPFQLSSCPTWRRPCGTESSGWCRAAGGLSCDVTAESDGVFPAVCGSDVLSECSGMCFCSATNPN